MHVIGVIHTSTVALSANMQVILTYQRWFDKQRRHRHTDSWRTPQPSFPIVVQFTKLQGVFGVSE